MQRRKTRRNALLFELANANEVRARIHRASGVTAINAVVGSERIEAAWNGQGQDVKQEIETKYREKRWKKKGIAILTGARHDKVVGLAKFKRMRQEKAPSKGVKVSYPNLPCSKPHCRLDVAERRIGSNAPIRMNDSGSRRTSNGRTERPPRTRNPWVQPHVAELSDRLAADKHGTGSWGLWWVLGDV